LSTRDRDRFGRFHVSRWGCAVVSSLGAIFVFGFATAEDKGAQNGGGNQDSSHEASLHPADEIRNDSRGISIARGKVLGLSPVKPNYSAPRVAPSLTILHRTLKSASEKLTRIL
jgi:hypothetical protein